MQLKPAARQSEEQNEKIIHAIGPDGGRHTVVFTGKPRGL
jgi:hypothetical protein